MNNAISTKRCHICKKSNDTVYWHMDPDTGSIYCYCNGCGRAYSLYNYCKIANISMSDYLKNDFSFEDAKSNEVRQLSCPASFVSLNNPIAQEGYDYIESRGLRVEMDAYFDTEEKGIVFPLYYENIFAGAQIRFINPRLDEEGKPWKITTLPGSRLGLLFYGWNQSSFKTDIKSVIICEGAFNAIAIQQSLNDLYGGFAKNPFKAIACSGSGGSNHHTETIKELRDNGITTILAPDSDAAGLKMLSKFHDAEAASHYAMTGDSEKDWNDVLAEIGHAEFAKYFLSRIKKT